VPGVPRDAGDQAVAYGGGVFLVVWIDRRQSRLRAARVDRNGVVIDQSGILLSDVFSAGPTMAFDGTNFLVVAFDGTNFLVVWLERSEGNLTAVVTARPVDGDFAVVYGRYVPGEPYGTTRAFLRRISPQVARSEPRLQQATT
jgi:hypothetical protein